MSLSSPHIFIAFVLALHRRNTYPDCKCDIAEVTLPPPTSPPPPAPPTPALAPQEAEQQQEGEEPARTCFCGYFSEVGTKHNTQLQTPARITGQIFYLFVQIMPNYKNSHTSYRLFTGPKHFSL